MDLDGEKNCAEAVFLELLTRKGPYPVLWYGRCPYSQLPWARVREEFAHRALVVSHPAIPWYPVRLTWVVAIYPVAAFLLQTVAYALRQRFASAVACFHV